MSRPNSENGNNDRKTRYATMCAMMDQVASTLARFKAEGRRVPDVDSTAIATTLLLTARAIKEKQESFERLAKCQELVSDWVGAEDTLREYLAWAQKRRRKDVLAIAEIIRRLAHALSFQGKDEEANALRSQILQNLSAIAPAPLLDLYANVFGDIREDTGFADATQAPGEQPFRGETFNPRAGEVFWADLPNHPDDRKRRPVVVLYTANGRSTVLVVPLTSNTSPHPDRIPFPKTICPGLPQDSSARLSGITDLGKSLLLEKIGQVKLRHVTEVIRAIKRRMPEHSTGQPGDEMPDDQELQNQQSTN